MAVNIVIELPAKERIKFRERLRWFKERVPTKEFLVTRPYPSDSDGFWDSMDGLLTAEVAVWSDDADRVATEFWFKFP